MTREAEIGKRFADKLVKVWTIAGEQVWVLLHIEVQSQRDTTFAQRMYTYNYRLRDRFDRPVVSFAILSDDQAQWRPQQFFTELWGCSVDFKFRTVKLLDYTQRWDELMLSRNPFAVVVMAHLKTLETVGDRLSRRHWKLSLIKTLYQKGYDRKDIIQLLSFIDWLLVLPVELESALWKDILSFQEEMKMPYVTSWERIFRKEGRQEGRQEGLREGLLRGLKLGLELKFGEKGLELSPDLEKIVEIETLVKLQEDLKSNVSLDEFRQLCQSQ